MSDTTTFLDACMYGSATVSDVDDWIDRWHDTDGAPDGAPISLRDYLGLGEKQYARWVHDSSVLRDLVVERAYSIRDKTMQTAGDWSTRPAVQASPNALAIC